MMPVTPTSTPPITYEQSFTLPENQFEEIVRGESRIMPPASAPHNDLLRRLEKILEGQLGDRFDIRGPGDGLGILKEPLTYRLPDKMLFPTGVRKRMNNPVFIWEPPVLVVECLSPANRKGPVEELLEDYRSIRVPEVWLLKPEQNACDVYSGENLGTMMSQSDGVVRFRNIAQVSLSMLWTAFYGF